MNKSELRQEIKAKRKLFYENNKELKDRYDDELIEELINDEQYKKAKNIFCYIGMNEEINTKRFIERALKDEKNISVPKVIKKHEMKAINISSLNDLVEVPPFGILEPRDCENVMKDIDLIIVPGLAFDNNGGRLGYGGGFYDAFLEKNSKAQTIALCYYFQLLEYIPMEEHDIRVKKIISK